MKIVILPGHGGKDPGAVNDQGVMEKDIALSLARCLEAVLLDAGEDVVMSRRDDTYVSPAHQLALIQSENPDCAIAIHCNSSVNSSAHGIETIYRDENDHQLAEYVHKELIAGTEMKDRGIRHDSETPHKRLAVLGDFDTPACLVEVGFISNEADMDAMDEVEERIQIAGAIAAGIFDWMAGK